MQNKFVAVLPLRGGSKSISKKNIKLINGQPLYCWSLSAAIKSNVFSHIYVSTDCPEIKTEVEGRYPSVTVINRPSEFASDTATSESVLLHALEVIQPADVVCMIQATSPLTSVEDFINASKKFNSDGLDSLVTVVEDKRFYWSKDAQPLNYDPQNRPRRQDFEGTFKENGAFYFTKTDLLTSTQCRLGGKIGIYQMPNYTDVEIDEPSDWSVVEQLLIHHKSQDYNLENIKGIVLDVDGTMTDGGMYYSAAGEELKKFNTRDAHGLVLLRKYGVKVGVITAEDSPRVDSRMKKLKIEDYEKGIKNKLPVLKKMASKWGLSLSELAYVGDDWGDLECLQNVGLSVCPGDATSIAVKNSKYICKNQAGHGAIREICDLILEKYI